MIEVRVRDNQFVEAGTVLARIDPKDYEVAVAKAKADLAEAEATMQADRTEVPIMSASSASRLDSAHSAVQESKATLATAEQQVESAQVRVKSAQAMLRQAQANGVRAASDFKRYEALLAKDEISKQQYDAAKSTADATQAQVEASQAQVHEAEQAVRVAQSQLGEHRAKLARSESDEGGGHGSAAGVGDTVAGGVVQRQDVANEGRPGAGGAEPELHHGACAGERDCQPEEPGSGADHQRRAASDGGGPDG